MEEGTAHAKAWQWECAWSFQGEQGGQCGWGGVNEEDVIGEEQTDNRRVNSGRTD